MQEYIEFRNRMLEEIATGLSSQEEIWEYHKSTTSVSKEEFMREVDKATKDRIYVESFLRVSKVFIVDDDVSQLLYMTKNKVYKRKTPFDNFFINTSLTLKDGSVMKGILVFKYRVLDEYHFTACPLMIYKDGSTSILKFDLFAIIKTSHIYAEKSSRVFGFLDVNMNPILKGGEIQNFACNFLDFLNNPEVEIVEVERDEEQNKKRIARDKIPLPSQVLVRVTGTIKKYLNELRSSGHFSYSHRFWVRGHFRTLRAERYGDNVGMKRWIFPYIKGEGILIQKAYNVKK